MQSLDNNELCEAFEPSKLDAENPYCGTLNLDSNAAAAIEDIKQWIKEDQRLNYRHDSSYIARFLRICDYDIDATKKRITRYNEVRHASPNWFDWSQKSVDILTQLYQFGVGYPVTSDTLDSQIVLVFKPGCFDAKKIKVEDFIAFISLTSEIFLDDTRYQDPGCHVLIDFKDMGIDYISQLMPSLLRRSNNWQLNAPIKLVKFHVFNGPTFLNTLLALTRFFLSKEVNEKIVIHKADYKSIHEYIPTQLLPFEYGGTAGNERHFLDIAGSFALKKTELFKQHFQN